MKTLKELIKNKQRVWFEVGKESKTEFLQFAKNNGCLWMNGKEIKPTKDDVGYHMGINSNFKLGFVSLIAWQLGDDITKIKFNAIKEQI